MIKSLFFRN